ncbi:MAG: hypothetical protein WD830_01020 [Chloroflexota bacterium]
MFRPVAFVFLLVVLGAIGVAVYDAGVAAGINQAVQQAVVNGQPVPVVPYAYGPHWHGGLGFFGIFFWIIGFFLIVGLIRAAFGLGRWGRGGWDKSGHGPGGRGGWGYGGRGYGGRGEAVADWHRELHRRDESTETDKPTGPPTAGS